MTASGTPRVRLLELDALDARELERALPDGSYEVEREQLRPGQHGDLGLTAAIVVLLAPPVIQAMTAWLLKKRRKGSVELLLENISPDGTTERRAVTVKFTDSDAPQADVLKQIVDGLNLDPEIAAAVMGAK